VVEKSLDSAKFHCLARNNRAISTRLHCSLSSIQCEHFIIQEIEIIQSDHAQQQGLQSLDDIIKDVDHHSQLFLLLFLRQRCILQTELVDFVLVKLDVGIVSPWIVQVLLYQLSVWELNMFAVGWSMSETRFFFGNDRRTPFGIDHEEQPRTLLPS